MRTLKVLRLIVGIAVILGLFASAASAVTLGADLASITDMSATPLASMTSDLRGFDGAHGSLKTEAFSNASGLTTYIITRTSGFANSITELWTNFAIPGIAGKAGWSFADATNAGTTFGSSIFLMNGTHDWLDWNTIASGHWTPKFWNTPNPDGTYPSIRFFYQSIYGPGPVQLYGAIGSTDLTGEGLAPSPNRVPEPGTLLLLGSGLLGAGLWARSRRART